MEPAVRNTFAFLLPQFINETSFNQTSSVDLHLFIEQLFELSIISNYLVLLYVIAMKPSNNLFNSQAVDVNVQHVTNILINYPLILNRHDGDTYPNNVY